MADNEAMKKMLAMSQQIMKSTAASIAKTNRALNTAPVATETIGVNKQHAASPKSSSGGFTEGCGNPQKKMRTQATNNNDTQKSSLHVTAPSSEASNSKLSPNENVGPLLKGTTEQLELARTIANSYAGKGKAPCPVHANTRPRTLGRELHSLSPALNKSTSPDKTRAARISAEEAGAVVTSIKITDPKSSIAFSLPKPAVKVADLSPIFKITEQKPVIATKPAIKTTDPQSAAQIADGQPATESSENKLAVKVTDVTNDIDDKNPANIITKTINPEFKVPSKDTFDIGHLSKALKILDINADLAKGVASTANCMDNAITGINRKSSDIKNTTTENKISGSNEILHNNNNDVAESDRNLASSPDVNTRLIKLENQYRDIRVQLRDLERIAQDVHQYLERRQFLGTDEAKAPFNINVMLSNKIITVQGHKELKVNELCRRVFAKTNIHLSDVKKPRLSIFEGAELGHCMSLGELGVTQETLLVLSYV